MTESARPELPVSLAANPELSTWFGFDEPGRVAVRIGKVELGQGIITALAQIAAEELGVGLDRIAVLAANTRDGPAEGLTAGSMSIVHSGSALRHVAAETRAALLAVTAERLGLDAAALSVRDGTIVGPDGSDITTYWDVARDGLLAVAASGTADPRPPTAESASPRRLDLPDKVFGVRRFIHDLALPGQVYGRIVRPPSRGARLVDVDEGALADIGVLAVVREGDLLGVIAEREELAVRAVERLAAAAQWAETDLLPADADLPGLLRNGPADPIDVVDGEGAEVPGVVTRVGASYSRPFLAHASMAPSCGVAHWDDDELTVWSHTQGVHPLRAALAAAFGQPAVTVHHVEGAGSYGHNAADDAAFDAAWLARAVPGRPVQVVWSRADELGWAPLGSAMVVDLEAGLDAGGRIVSWQHDGWSYGHIARPGYAGSHGLLGAADRDRSTLPAAVDPPLTAGGGIVRNADPGYDFASRRITGHRVTDAPLRTSALRALGAFVNVFAIESFMDELARRAGADPVRYRLDHLSDPRGRAVIEGAVRAAGWRSRPSDGSVGYGLGYARYKGTSGYCAVVAEVEAETEVRVRRLVIAADVGRVVSLDGVVNQVEGGAIQATSWTLLERVRYNRRTVTSTDWESYPILRFSQVPAVEVEVISRPDQPSLGAGEIAQGPTAAAIANAVREVLGVDVRDLPLTPERIVAAIEE